MKKKLYNNFNLNIEKKGNHINNENIDNNEKNEINEKSFEPKFFQIIYFYNYYKPVYPKTKLKTKENTKTINMYDYYTYDLY